MTYYETLWLSSDMPPEEDEGTAMYVAIHDLAAAWHAAARQANEWPADPYLYAILHACGRILEHLRRDIEANGLAEEEGTPDDNRTL